MKTAQMYPGIDYGGGELAGYGQGGYHVSMDDPRLEYGAQMMPPERQTKLPSWMIPAGVVGGGLAALAALAAMKRGKMPVAKAVAPGAWEREMLARGGSRYRSVLHPGESVGHGYVPGIEEGVATKISAARTILGLGAIAREEG